MRVELNVYFIPTNFHLMSYDVEDLYVKLLKKSKKHVSIPVAMKLSPYFSAMPHMASMLDAEGADALVLFNRFYQPDIDIEELEVTPNLHAEHARRDAPASALDRHPLRALGLLHGPHQRHPQLPRMSSRPSWLAPTSPMSARCCSKRAWARSPNWWTAWRVDGRARIRVGRADEGQHEPQVGARAGGL